MSRALSALAALAALVALAAADTVYLTVAYCPTLSSSAGAVVAVDTAGGNFSVVGVFEFPSDVFGCAADYDPAVAFDKQRGSVFLLFTELSGLVVEVALADGRLNRLSTTRPSDPFFNGFVNFYTLNNGSQEGAFVVASGFSPTVTQNGYCNDGCFEFGKLLVPTGEYAGLHLVPFKALMDDVAAVDPASDTVAVQVAYDLRDPDKMCVPGQAEAQCLARFSQSSGALVSALPIAFTVYQYAGQPAVTNASAALAWAIGGNPRCGENRYYFAEIDLVNASIARHVSCISPEVVVHMDEWIAAFSDDASLFATASGNSETGEIQLLTFDVQSGATVLNTNLTGLPEKLGAAQGIVLVWGVSFL